MSPGARAYGTDGGCAIGVAVDVMEEESLTMLIDTASVGGMAGDFIRSCHAIAPGAVMTPALADNLPAEMIEGIRYITGQVITVDDGMTSHHPLAETRRPDAGS